jgi:non-specific serine/threonine protein kinase
VVAVSFRGASRDAPRRQQTLRDTINWSYELLTPSQQRVFTRLAVFHGGWTFAAAEAIVPDDGDEFDTLEELGALVDHNLVVSLTHPNGARFGMLETIAEFAGERLLAGGDAEDVRRRHALWFLEFAEASERYPEVFRSSSSAAFTPELANLRDAMNWYVEHDQPIEFARLAAATVWYWFQHGQYAEGRAWLTRAADYDLMEPATLRARVLLGAGMFASRSGQSDLAVQCLAECVAIARVQRDARTLVHALAILGQLQSELSRFEHATAALSEAELLCRAAGWNELESAMATELGVVALREGDLPRARAYAQQALAHDQRAGYENHMTASVLEVSSVVAWQSGNHQEALTHLRRSIEVARRIDYPHTIAQSFIALATASDELGQPARAAWLLGASDRLCERMNAVLLEPQRSYRDEAAPSLAARLGQAQYQAEIDAGRKAPLDAAIEHANEIIDQLLNNVTRRNSVPPGDGSGLTAREREVLRLLVEGRTNREIADALFITQRTAATHVTNILTKLNLESRTAAAAHAVRHGLVDPHAPGE